MYSSREKTAKRSLGQWRGDPYSTQIRGGAGAAGSANASLIADLLSEASAAPSATSPVESSTAPAGTKFDFAANGALISQIIQKLPPDGAAVDVIELSRAAPDISPETFASLLLWADSVGLLRVRKNKNSDIAVSLPSPA